MKTNVLPCAASSLFIGVLSAFGLRECCRASAAADAGDFSQKKGREDAHFTNPAAAGRMDTNTITFKKPRMPQITRIKSGEHTACPERSRMGVSRVGFGGLAETIFVLRARKVRRRETRRPAPGTVALPNPNVLVATRPWAVASKRRAAPWLQHIRVIRVIRGRSPYKIPDSRNSVHSVLSQEGECFRQNLQNRTTPKAFGAENSLASRSRAYFFRLDKAVRLFLIGVT